MPLFLSHALSFLGRHAAIALPISVSLGLIIPSLAEMLTPLLVPALLTPLTLSLVRIQTDQLVNTTQQWKLLSLLCIWVLIMSPLIIWGLLSISPIPEPIAMAAIIASTAPPVSACAAIALFLRLNAALSVVITVVTMLLIPLTLPPMVHYLVGLEIEISLWQLSLRLTGFILAAFLLALGIKRFIGTAQVKNLAPVLDGISVIFISLFIIGIMRGVTELFLQQPEFVWLTLGVSSAVIFGLYLLSTLIFWRLGASTAMAIGLVSGNCNLGLMYLVLADQAPLKILIFFAIGQIPMYCLPTLLAPIIRCLLLTERRRQ
ncbi:MAG: BASS family bile acid:Na+ symporter [Candidatus Endobugula sp.]|jgi:BASS family bile acid:Na+ symporter